MRAVKISLVTRFAWVGISTSVLNTALFWEENGCEVEIVAIDADQKRFPFPDFRDKKIKVNCFTIDGRVQLLTTLFSANLKKLLQYSKWIIAFDVDALVITGCVNFTNCSNLIYHSLEFYEIKYESTLGTIKKHMERHFAQHGKGVFTQDDRRGAFLKNDLGLSSFQCIYNSPSGHALPMKCDYFRSKFHISGDRTIVLCIGSLLREHYLVELLQSVPSWDDKYVLMLHGWFSDITIRTMVDKLLVKFPNRIYVSTELFDDRDRFVPYQASDIVFAGFIPSNNNTKLAAGSAGKIFDAMKAGKPILGFDTPGMRDLVEGNEIGYVFSDPSDINSTLAKISADYVRFSSNAHIAFYKYEFNAQYMRVAEELHLMNWTQ